MHLRVDGSEEPEPLEHWNSKVTWLHIYGKLSAALFRPVLDENQERLLAHIPDVRSITPEVARRMFKFTLVCSSNVATWRAVNIRIVKGGTMCVSLQRFYKHWPI